MAQAARRQRVQLFPSPSPLRLLSLCTHAIVQTVVGIVSPLNDRRISKSESPLGFLNSWLYDDSFKGLTDITSGSNPCCDTDGFSTIAGWDLVRPARLISSSMLIGSELRRSHSHGFRDGDLFGSAEQT
ncbi:hypothetical protein H4582DRAFT_2030877 [Lactarius indigo]|nr:hypothetical protein H4582DRAFT_2030877 [Lactarius indigo]